MPQQYQPQAQRPNVDPGFALNDRGQQALPGFYYPPSPYMQQMQQYPQYPQQYPPMQQGMYNLPASPMPKAPTGMGGAGSGVLSGLAAYLAAKGMGGTGPAQAAAAAAKPAAAIAAVAKPSASIVTGAAPTVPTGISATIPAGNVGFGMGTVSPLIAGIAAAPLAAEVATQSVEGVKKIFDGEKDLDLREQAALALPTFGLSFAYNPVKKMFGSGKGKEQVARDEARNFLRENTSIYEGKDGLIGIGDGKYFDTRTYGKPSYNIDWNDKTAGDRVGAIAPLTVAALGTGDEKVRQQLQSELANAISGGDGDVIKNLQAVYRNSGLSRDDIGTGIWMAYNEGMVDEAHRDAALAENDLLHGVDNPNARPEDTARAHSNARYGILG